VRKAFGIKIGVVVSWLW